MASNDILSIIADNPALQDALKALLKEQFETPLAEVDALTDSDIGQRVRARLYGKRAIEKAFVELNKYRSRKEGPGRENPAR